MAKATFEYEKDCKHSIRFKEVVEDRFTTAMIGTLYVRKDLLANIGWRANEQLVVTVEIKEGK